MPEIKCVFIKYSTDLARLGPGSTWARVLKFIPATKYTMVHGQCTSVGVGGYLLGGGVNFVATTAKYGTGASNVLEYTMVTATGDIVVVRKDNVTRLAHGVKEAVLIESPSENCDLFFSLKGAGSSYGIVTEFLYRIYPGPEIRPSLIPLDVTNVQDLKKLKWLNEQGRFDVTLLRIFQYTKLTHVPENFVSSIL